MKKIIIIFILAFVAMISYGQKMFITQLENGVGQKVPINFSISDTTEILESELFKAWEDQTYNNQGNAGYLEKHKQFSHLELFLISQTKMASFHTQLLYKNMTSYSPVENSEGFIYMKDGNLKISMTTKGQNGYGNYILSKHYIEVYLEDNKLKYDVL